MQVRVYVCAIYLNMCEFVHVAVSLSAAFPFYQFAYCFASMQIIAQ